MALSYTNPRVPFGLKTLPSPVLFAVNVCMGLKGQYVQPQPTMGTFSPSAGNQCSSEKSPPPRASADRRRHAFLQHLRVCFFLTRMTFLLQRPFNGIFRGETIWPDGTARSGRQTFGYHFQLRFLEAGSILDAGVHRQEGYTATPSRRVHRSSLSSCPAQAVQGCHSVRFSYGTEASINDRPVW